MESLFEIALGERKRLQGSWTRKKGGCCAQTFEGGGGRTKRLRKKKT